MMNSLGRRSFLAGLAEPLLALTASKPNIVLIMADDLGYGDLGCYGNTHIRTPNVDSLAAGGVRFTDFHSNGAVCSPTRAALMTGRYQQRAGIDEVVYAATARHHGLDPSEVTIADVLRKAGYATAIFGKWHLGYQPSFNPDKQGFQDFRGFVSGNVDYFSHVDQAGYADWWHNSKLTPEEGYTTELITEHGLEFIQRHRGKPFFLYLAHESVHSPYQRPGDTTRRKAGGKPDLREPREDVSAVYREMIEVMDAGIGKILGELRDLPKGRETFVFFLSDNGPTRNGSAGPLRGWKGQLWEGGHRVPAVAYWPGRIAAGRVSHETAMSMDLFPTILEAAGISAATPSLDGVSLWRHLEKAVPLPERPLFWAYQKQRAVRWRNWKLNLYPNQPAWLSDLSQDVTEAVNVAGERPAILDDLKRKLDVWERDVHSGREVLQGDLQQ
jgi:arylsulfatase A-like enzyme